MPMIESHNSQNRFNEEKRGNIMKKSILTKLMIYKGLILC